MIHLQFVSNQLNQATMQTIVGNIPDVPEGDSSHEQTGSAAAGEQYLTADQLKGLSKLYSTIVLN